MLMIGWLLTGLVALPPVLPVAEVVRGQQGQCLTVFEGHAIEAVPFVVKGVLRNHAGPGKDVVLVRLLGERAEFTGVVAGMSGSPCSIGERLVGALSYAFGAFAKEPVAGITPIEQMTAVLDLAPERLPWRVGEPQAGGRPWQAGVAAWRAGASDAWAAGWGGAAAVAAGAVESGSGAQGLQTLATPLAMAGVTARVQAFFAPWLRAVGFAPSEGAGVGAAGAAAGGAALRERALVPGAAVAAVLVRGDVEIAATGTVTAVEGGRVLAFGHPFMGLGAVSMPMAQADIVNIMASQMRSFKMAVVGPTLGEITQDRLTAVSGQLGAQASMITVRGQVRSGGPPQRFTFEVARDVALSPRLVAMGVANALAGRVDAGERGMVRLNAVVRVAGVAPVRLEQVYAAERDDKLLIYPGVDVGQYFAALWDSSFGPPPPMQVEVEAVVESEPVQEAVEAIYLDRAHVRAGQRLEVAVRLRRYNGAVTVERFTVAVPEAWVGQKVRLVAAGAPQAERLEAQLGGRPRPTQLGDVAAWLNRRRSAGKLYLMAVREGAGMQAGVERLDFLPPSAIATAWGGVAKQLSREGLAWEERRARPGVVDGQAQATVTIAAR